MSNKNLNPRATESLRHFMLKVFCAILKTAPFSVNSSSSVSAFYDRSSQGNNGGGTEEDENWAKNGEYVGQSLLTTRAVAELGEAEFCELTSSPSPTNKQNTVGCR